MSLSSALPKFSIWNQAEALSPRNPWPVENIFPSGPVIDKPRVRFTSIGITKFMLIRLSESKVIVSINEPESEPSAELGMVACMFGDQGVPSGSMVTDWLNSGFKSSIVQFSGILDVFKSILHSAARLPVARMLMSNSSEAPGSILVGVGGNEIAKS